MALSDQIFATVSLTTDAELAYVHGVTSSVQTQINARAVSATTLAGYGITDGQPLDADLTWVAANLTTAGRAILDDADAAAQRTTLGLGTLATQSGTFSGTSSGTNTGDQTITLSGDATGSGTGAITVTLGASKVTNSNLVGNIASSKLVGSDITVVGTIATGVWNGTAIGSGYLSGVPKQIGTPGRQNTTCTGAGVQNLYTQAIAANTLGSTGKIKFKFFVRRTSGSGTAIVNVAFGGTTFHTTFAQSAANSAAFAIEGELWGDGATNTQRGRMWVSPTNAALASGYGAHGTAAIDQTGSANLTLGIDLGTDGDTFTLDQAEVWQA